MTEAIKQDEEEFTEDDADMKNEEDEMTKGINSRSSMTKKRTQRQ